MFRTRSAVSSPGIIGTGIALLIAIVIATGLNLWIVVEIQKEQKAIGEIVRGGIQEDINRLGTLPAELGWQLLFTIVVLVVLIVAAITLLFVVRAYARSQATLRDTVTLAQDILSSIDYGVITTDTTCQITSMNDPAREMLATDVVSPGHSLIECFPSESRMTEMCQLVLERGTAIHDETLVVPADDRRRELLVDCHSLCGANGTRQGTVLHIRDVTQQKLLEQRMRRMEQFMGLGTLAAGLHHEIKNPLSALSLHVQLLEEGLVGQLDQQQAENLNVLKTEVTRIAGVLESFRDYASNEQLNVAALDMRQVVRQTVELIKPQATAQQVTVTCDIAPSLSRIEGDTVRLEQVLLNLAINALEAMREGGHLTVNVQEMNDNIVIGASDTGPGIPEDVRRFILDPYFTTKSSGSGMGLAVCDKIIRQHGGQLSFESNHVGTTFFVTLPIAQE